jgi:hypothetical protein
VVQRSELSPRDFPEGSIYLRPFIAGVSTLKAVFFNRVKAAGLLIKVHGIKIPRSPGPARKTRQVHSLD